jgi:hypothetical protein
MTERMQDALNIPM